MSTDDPEKRAPASPELAGRPLNEFPSSTFPTVFADGVASFSAGAGVVKIYFHRADPNMFGRGGVLSNATFQVVMPTLGFAQMAVFFQRRLEILIGNKVFSEDDIEKMKLGCVDKPLDARIAN
jgi:hypothetical protein